jgi:hypothetical protein
MNKKYKPLLNFYNNFLYDQSKDTNYCVAREYFPPKLKGDIPMEIFDG